MKITFFAGIARRITESIGTTNIPSVAEQLDTLAAHVGMVNSMLSGMERPTRHSTMVRAEPAFHYSAQVLTQDLYPRVIRTRRSRRSTCLFPFPPSPGALCEG